MCGCNGKTNQTVMSPEELVAAAQGRADQRREAEAQSKSSQQNATANASA